MESMLSSAAARAHAVTTLDTISSSYGDGERLGLSAAGEDLDRSRAGVSGEHRVDAYAYLLRIADERPVDEISAVNRRFYAASAPCLDDSRPFTDGNSTTEFFNITAISGEAGLQTPLKPGTAAHPAALTAAPCNPAPATMTGAHAAEPIGDTGSGVQKDDIPAAPAAAGTPQGSVQPATPLFLDQRHVTLAATATAGCRPGAAVRPSAAPSSTADGTDWGPARHPSAESCSAGVDGGSSGGRGGKTRCVEEQSPLKMGPRRPQVVPSILSLVSDVSDLDYQPRPAGCGGTLLGTWRGLKVVVKLAFCPAAEPCAALLRAADLVCRSNHPSLVTVYDTRVARVDEDALAVLDPPPVLRPGWGPGSRRPAGRLQQFVAAHIGPTQQPRESGGGSGRRDCLTVYPGDVLVGRPPQAPAEQALMALRLQPGGYVVASLVELCDMGDLRSLACSEDTPFRASRSWTLHVAQRALLRTARELASALRALHAAGITHGGLRPSNVLLSRSSHDRRGFVARLADVGLANPAHVALATSYSLASGPGMLMLAPEVLTDGSAAVSPAADVYGLGMLLYLMAAGEIPFQDQHPVPVLMAVTSEGLRPEWPAGQHDHLEPLYRRCVAHKPEDRPTAQEVVAEVCALEQQIKDAKGRKALRPPA